MRPSAGRRRVSASRPWPAAPQVPSGGRERRPRWVPGLGAFLGQQRPLQGTAGFHFSILALSRRLPRLNSGEEAALRLFC